MQTLSRAYLGDAAPPRRPVRVLQIGDGVFLRGFVDWMIDVVNEKGLASLGVAIALARPHSEPPKLASQDGLYTVIERGLVDGANHEASRIVTAVEQVFDPHREPQTFRALAVSPELRFIASNTTEAGIVEAAEPYDPEVCPRNFPAKVAWLLKARFDALGAAHAPGLIVLPCELIEANGRTLKRFVLSAAEGWGLGADFKIWIETRNLFLDTLVDRIVPGFPTADAESLFARWGYRDPFALMAEPFHLWVIEGDVASELPFVEAGLNVIWTRDLRPYREGKVRMLNGAHTATALPAFLAGLDTVKEAISDPQFSRYVERLMFSEIAPYVDLPTAEREAYGRSVLARFQNPFLRHELSAIAMNSISKWKARLLPTLRDAVTATGRAPELVAYSFAALLWFYRGKAERGPYQIRDDAGAVALMAAAWDGPGSTADIATALMRETRLWGEDLTAIPTFAMAVTAAVSDLEALGVRGALARRI